jgi:assimilatory nitrate reductase catalytic subunit
MTFQLTKNALSKGVTAYLQSPPSRSSAHPLIRRNVALNAHRGMKHSIWLSAIQRAASKLQQRLDRSLLRLFTDDREDVSDGEIRARGTRHCYVDYNGRLYMVSAAAGNNKAFRSIVRNPWSDIPLADVLLIARSNCAETFPVLNKFSHSNATTAAAGSSLIHERRRPHARTICIYS